MSLQCDCDAARDEAGRDLVFVTRDASGSADLTLVAETSQSRARVTRVLHFLTPTALGLRRAEPDSPEPGVAITVGTRVYWCARLLGELDGELVSLQGQPSSIQWRMRGAAVDVFLPTEVGPEQVWPVAPPGSVCVAYTPMEAGVVVHELEAGGLTLTEEQEVVAAP